MAGWLRDGHTSTPCMTFPAPVVRGWLKPWMIVAALVVAASIALNLFATNLGYSPPWLLGVNLVVALFMLGGSILAVAKLASRTDEEASRMRVALDASQARLAAIVDSAMDAIVTVDQNQCVVLFNRAAEQVFRCSREDALGSSLDRFMPSRFRSAPRGHIQQFGKTGVTSRRMGDVTTLWAVRADSGEEFPIEASISQATEDGDHYYTVILRDITARKQYEDELKQRQNELRKLSAQVLEAREEEKTRIARELHDELGQMLTALKMDLGWIRGRIGASDAEVAGKTEKMWQTLDQTVTSVRRIAADLRPLMLDDLGLADAAAWLVEDFSKRSGIVCRTELAGPGELQDLPNSVATAIYRAIQESLTNIARHSGAKNAWIALTA